MCKHCIKKQFPDRADTCLDTGHYLVNCNVCHECKQRGNLTIAQKVIQEEEEDTDYEETTTYNHVCNSCNHVVAEHYYQFTISVDNNGVTFQNYIMACALCGKGGDIRKIDEPKSKTEKDSLAGETKATVSTETTTTTTMDTNEFANSSLLNRVAAQTMKDVDEDDEDWS